MYDYFFPFVKPYYIAEEHVVFLPCYGAFHGAGTYSMDGLPTYSLSSSDFVPSHLSEFPIPALSRAIKKQAAVPKAHGARSLPGEVMQEQRKHQHIAKVAIPLTRYANSFFISFFPIH